MYSLSLPIIPCFTLAKKKQKFSVSCIQRQIKKKKKIYIKWLERWRITLNVSKTNTIIFETKTFKELRKISINGSQINWSKEAQYLGI